MRKALICLVGVALVAACSKPATPAPKADAAAPAATPAVASASAPASAPAVTGPAVSGVYSANGKAAALTVVTARNDEPFDDKPVVDLVFTTKDQGGDPKADFGASFGRYGDAIVVKVQPDGSVIGSELVHSGLRRQGMVSVSGPISIKDYRVAGGQISGRVTSGGTIDVFDDKVEIDLTFHTKAP